MKDKLEPIEIIKGSLTLEEYQGYLRGNILKYVSSRNKEDLIKAKRYLEELINIKEAKK